MKTVWDHSQHAETDLVVMLALADMSNTDGYCFPSIPTLAQRSRRKVRSMINTLERLSASGELFIDRSRGRNHHNRYVITIRMSKESLASVLVRYMSYDPTVAVNAANDYLEKHAVDYQNVQPTTPLTEPVNMQSATQNVQWTARLNVQSATSKTCSPLHPIQEHDPSLETKKETKTTTISDGLPFWNEVQAAYENNIGTFTPITSELVQDAIKTYGGAIVIDAITEAVKQNVRKWAYVDGILKRRHANGKTQPIGTKPAPATKTRFENGKELPPEGFKVINNLYGIGAVS